MASVSRTLRTIALMPILAEQLGEHFVGTEFGNLFIKWIKENEIARNALELSMPKLLEKIATTLAEGL